MAELILIAAIVVIFAINKASTERKLDNYDISKIDNTKLTRDMCNRVSVANPRR